MRDISQITCQAVVIAAAAGTGAGAGHRRGPAPDGPSERPGRAGGRVLMWRSIRATPRNDPKSTRVRTNGSTAGSSFQCHRRGSDKSRPSTGPGEVSGLILDGIHTPPRAFCVDNRRMEEYRTFRIPHPTSQLGGEPARDRPAAARSRRTCSPISSNAGSFHGWGGSAPTTRWCATSATAPTPPACAWAPTPSTAPSTTCPAAPSPTSATRPGASARSPPPSTPDSSEATIPTASKMRIRCAEAAGLPLTLRSPPVRPLHA